MTYKYTSFFYDIWRPNLSRNCDHFFCFLLEALAFGWALPFATGVGWAAAGLAGLAGLASSSCGLALDFFRTVLEKF